MCLRNTRFLVAFLLLLACTLKAFGQENAQSKNKGVYKVLLEEPRQQIWGLGFEIQSDAIASGNMGLPESNSSVPYDLIPSERNRFYSEMLSGFRYCRIAGGLYFRGTTADQKELRPRWSTQLQEIKEMITKSGIEGISLEYWSPAPYWKANGKYEGADGTENILRCFGKNFRNDPVYKGDTVTFLKDFGTSLVNDIKLFEDNGIKVNMWGLQNEPPVDQHYSSCVYDVDQYTLTFNAVAPKVRAHNRDILIMSDSWEGHRKHARKINANPNSRKYVDAWVWHQIGWDSNSLIEQQQKYIKNTFGKPVFQNEYEYLQGGTSPARCLNTVQNIMNWFTFVDSPTWFWIHALKPTTNAEADGYALGFWEPLQAEGAGGKKSDETNLVKANGPRTMNGFEIKRVSKELIGLPSVIVKRGLKKKPGSSYEFTIDRKSEVYLGVDKTVEVDLPTGWVKTELVSQWDGEDMVYKRIFEAGVVDVPAHEGRNDDGTYGIPHIAFVKNISGQTGLTQVSGMTSGLGANVNVITSKLGEESNSLKPGHWTFNNFNWFAMAGFLKHMPWNSTRLKVEEDEIRYDNRILAFRTPDNKLVFVVTNRSGKDFEFKISTGINRDFKGYRYTPFEAGKDHQGVEVGIKRGSTIHTLLPDLSWEFWVEQ